MLHELKDIENAIINEAKNTLTYLKTVDSYGGELEDALQNLLPKYPCLLVAFDGGNFSGENYPAYFYDQEVRFSIILLDKSLRGDKERRQGADSKPGTYAMLKDTIELLAGKTLGFSGLKPFEPVTINSLLQGKTLSAYEIIFKTNMDYQTT